MPISMEYIVSNFELHNILYNVGLISPIFDIVVDVHIINDWLIPIPNMIF